MQHSSTPKISRKKIAENIELLRIKKNKTVKEMAKALQLSCCSYRNIERGITDITISKLLIIADYLNTHYTEIIGDINDSLPVKQENFITAQKQRDKDYRDEIIFLKKQISFLMDSFSDIKVQSLKKLDTRIYKKYQRD